jgi:dipeptidyl aminopeptidase/acylaminoacyl peptidase
MKIITGKTCVWLLLFITAAIVISQRAFAEARRPIVPSDCVKVRRFLNDNFRSSIQIDPTGKRVAYLVQSPNLQSNENDVHLDTQTVDGSKAEAQHLLVSTKISGLHWLAGGSAVTVLAKHNGRDSVLRVTAPAGHVEDLTAIPGNIAEYSISEDGRTIVFAVEEESPALKTTSEQDEARGYRIAFQKQQVSLFPKRKIFVTRMRQGGWTKPQILSVHLPSVTGTMDSFPYPLDLRLSLSPDGASLVFTYLANPAGVPEAWMKSTTVRAIIGSVGVVQITAVVDLKTGAASVPFESPWAWSVPFWSRDSRSFIISAVSPVGTSWEAEDVKEHRPPSDAVHQFEAQLDSGAVALVRSDLHGLYEQPLSWKLDGELLLHTGEGTLSLLRLNDGQWRETSQIRVPITRLSRNAEIASDGAVVAGDYESPSMPPSLYLYRTGAHDVQTLLSLNPEFQGLTLAPVREMHWQTATGYHATGLLFLPPDYDPHKRYPLVIHSYPAASDFFCDSGKNHDPSFAPQPIANAGMMYLIRVVPVGMQKRDEEAHYPKGYPGLLGEAAFQTDVWDSAVDQLASDGLIDANKVGIIGFSRSGWYTEFALTHGRTHYAAATVADNTQYSMGEYWMIHSDGVLRSLDAMYGGPPYGETLRNWLDHSISFNLPKIHSPLLMEVMGNGTHYTSDNAPPSNLALKWEVFAGLSRLKKPVEMYYYPLETHQPEHPQARLASLERNLDWYVFWLQARERPARPDPDQYPRWRELRKAYESERALGDEGSH